MEEGEGGGGMQDFVEKCLQMDPEDRWDVDRLLGHEFVVGAKEKGRLEVVNSGNEGIEMNGGGRGGASSKARVSKARASETSGGKEAWEEEIPTIAKSNRVSPKTLGNHRVSPSVLTSSSISITDDKFWDYDVDRNDSEVGSVAETWGSTSEEGGLRTPGKLSKENSREIFEGLSDPYCSTIEPSLESLKLVQVEEGWGNSTWGDGRGEMDRCIAMIKEGFERMDRMTGGTSSEKFRAQVVERIIGGGGG